MTPEVWNNMTLKQQSDMISDWEEKETAEIDSKIKSTLDIAGSIYYSTLTTDEIIRKIELKKFLPMVLYRKIHARVAGGILLDQYSYESYEKIVNTSKIISINKT